ncbi:MAG: glycosyltransferase family 2 protein [Flavobacteriales bacterium]
METKPHISVITVVYQAEKLVAKTMQSINSQSIRGRIESVVVDGASTDRTAEIVRPMQHEGDRFLSERDQGIYDAMNKGVQLARGEYIIFINAGDELFDAHSLENMLRVAEHCDVYYGETAIIDEEGKILGSRRLQPPKNLTWKSLRFGMCVSHQSILARRSIAPQFDLQYRISSDIDWTIRLLQQAQSVAYVDGYVSKFLIGGVSSSRRKKGLQERWSILSKHFGILPNFIHHIWITLRFILQRITRKQMN